jgi:O-antigen/teichoic acid export membrane protein
MPADPPKNAAIRRQVALSTISNYAGQVVNLVVWFLLTPFIIHRLGATQYGLWVVIASLVAYGNLAEFGVGSAIVKYVAEYRARGDSETATRIIATSLWIYCVLGLLVIAGGVILAPLVPHVIDVPPYERGTTSWLVVITTVGVAVQLPATAAASVLRAMNRYDLMNLIGSLSLATLAVSTVIVLALGGKVISMAAIVPPLTLFWLVPAVWLIHRHAPDLHFGFRGARRNLVRKVTSFGSSAFGLQVAGVLKSQSDEIIIGASLPVRTVAPYSVARRLSELPASLTYQFVDVLLPIVSRLDAEEDHGAVREVFVSATRLTLALFSAIGGALIIFAGPFLAAWVGPSFARSSNIVVLLTVAALLEALLWPAQSVLIGVNRHRPLVAFALGSAILNVTLSLLLIGPLGVRGVALGTLIATSIEASVSLPFAAHVLGVRVAQTLREIVLPGALPLIPMMAVLLVIRQFLTPTTIPTIALSGAAGALVYVAGYLAIPWPTSERVVALRLLGVCRAYVRRAISR